MKRLILAGALAAFLAPATVWSGGSKSIDERTEIGWCRYVPYVGWVCGWHD